MPGKDLAMTGQVCRGTGASRGIGFHTALGLAQQGGHAILVGHHEGRYEEALKRLESATEERS